MNVGYKTLTLQISKDNIWRFKETEQKLPETLQTGWVIRSPLSHPPPPVNSEIFEKVLVLTTIAQSQLVLKTSIFRSLVESWTRQLLNCIVLLSLNN